MQREQTLPEFTGCTNSKKKQGILVGFIGIENHELICWLGRLLQAMDCKVLLADCSETLQLPGVEVPPGGESPHVPHDQRC